jgi:hypothetical protein
MPRDGVYLWTDTGFGADQREILGRLDLLETAAESPPESGDVVYWCDR